ncbi:MAG: hypothetical protein ACYC5Y_03430 [Symbiobacteriia bacterium]
MDELHLSRDEWEIVYQALDEYVTEIKGVYNEGAGHQLVEQAFDLMQRIRSSVRS